MVVIFPVVTVETLVPIGKSLIIEVLFGKNITVGMGFGSTVAVTIIVVEAVPAITLEQNNNNRIRYLIATIIYQTWKHVKLPGNFPPIKILQHFNRSWNLRGFL